MANNVPKPGDIIYINSASYIDSPFRDIIGGKAKVQSATERDEKCWVVVEGFPTTSFNWESLQELQEYLKGEFGDTWARKP